MAIPFHIIVNFLALVNLSSTTGIAIQTKKNLPKATMAINEQIIIEARVFLD
jgi:hypothetical protein